LEKSNSQNPKLKRNEIVFETTDIYNIPITLSRATWEEKIKVDHPEVEDYLNEAKTTIEDPDVVIADSLRETTKIFSRFGMGKGQYHNLHLRTIVQYAGVGGRVASIHFANTLPKGKIICLRRITRN
jgi:hypothetical protein